jgi:AmmeMemoRadiSam system protein B
MNSVRRPVVAGMFYPSVGKELKKELDGFFKNAKDKRSCVGVVSPHAGYAYSGQTAAHAIASLKPARSFILLGPNHNSTGPGFAVMKQGSWSTPLGECRIDTGLASAIECGLLEEDAKAHSMEHSIEVQLPMLQHRFGDFGFVPISITNVGYTHEFLGQCKELGEAIAQTIKKKRSVAIVASSDFSHYIPADSAESIDREAMDMITKLDLKGFFSVLEERQASVCGYGPIAILMSAARALGLKGRLIEYTNSGERTGDLSSVVGYAALGFE